MNACVSHFCGVFQKFPSVDVICVVLFYLNFPCYCDVEYQLTFNDITMMLVIDITLKSRGTNGTLIVVNLTNRKCNLTLRTKELLMGVSCGPSGRIRCVG